MGIFLARKQSGMGKSMSPVCGGDTLFFSSEFGVYTFRRNIQQFSTLHNCDWITWLVTSTLWYILDLFDNVITFEDFTEDNMTAIEPGSDDSGDEELRPIGIFASVGHTYRVLV